jgi:putative oxidoreductase
MNRANDLKDWGISILRLAVGGVFVAHGAQKLLVYGISGVAGLMGQLGLPFPTLAALAVTGAELLGGLAVLVGFKTRWAALPIAFSMAVAALTVHLRNGFFLPQGAEYVLTLLLASVALSLTGSGALSVDRCLESGRPGAKDPAAPPGKLEGATSK